MKILLLNSPPTSDYSFPLLSFKHYCPSENCSHPYFYLFCFLVPRLQMWVKYCLPEPRLPSWVLHHGCPKVRGQNWTHLSLQNCPSPLFGVPPAPLHTSHSTLLNRDDTSWSPSLLLCWKRSPAPPLENTYLDILLLCLRSYRTNTNSLSWHTRFWWSSSYPSF